MDRQRGWEGNGRYTWIIGETFIGVSRAWGSVLGRDMMGRISEELAAG